MRNEQILTSIDVESPVEGVKSNLDVEFSRRSCCKESVSADNRHPCYCAILVLSVRCPMPDAQADLEWKPQMADREFGARICRGSSVWHPRFYL